MVPNNPLTESLRDLELKVVSCRRCPRLVGFREKVAREKKRRYERWTYWGKPVPGFGDSVARLLIVGLAPAPHGGNRTGRVFTGDKSGDFLVHALYKTGFANQPFSESGDDGLRLAGAYMTAAVKCAPPQHRPEASEIVNCSRFLESELRILRDVVAILCLGRTAYKATMAAINKQYSIGGTIPDFRHGLEIRLGVQLPHVFASYHPSPRNTQTGKLSEAMFLSLLNRIRRVVAPRWSRVTRQ